MNRYMSISSATVLGSKLCYFPPDGIVIVLVVPIIVVGIVVAIVAAIVMILLAVVIAMIVMARTSIVIVSIVPRLIAVMASVTRRFFLFKMSPLRPFVRLGLGRFILKPLWLVQRCQIIEGCCLAKLAA